jgi:2-methylcitrate dehydratase PrpD
MAPTIPAIPPAAGLTAQLAQFVAAGGVPTLTAGIRRTVRIGFADAVAVMMAGRDEPATRVVRAWVAARRGAGHSRLLLGAERASSRDAALVNGVATHALDYDDVGLQGHPSAVLVPALLAEGDRLGSSGEAVMRAYVAGYETWAELLLRDSDVHHLKGWHPTAIFGTVAAAAAVATLRGVDAVRARHALGLAASMAGGLTANFGSMAKPFHAGQAAAHGIDAADLAEAGMTAAGDVLEHSQGFLAAHSPQGRVDLAPLADDFGATPRIVALGLTVKKYPMCFATHRVLDAVLDLIHGHDVQPRQVERIEASVGPAQAAMLRNHAPADALQAKFSLEFALACALVARRCGLSELHDDFVARADVQSLFARVDIRVVDTVCAHEPTLSASDRVRLHLTDGRTLDSGEVHAARGDASLPLSDAEIKAKFIDCTRGIDAAAQQDLLGALLRLDELGTLDGLALAG